MRLHAAITETDSRSTNIRKASRSPASTASTTRRSFAITSITVPTRSYRRPLPFIVATGRDRVIPSSVRFEPPMVLTGSGPAACAQGRSSVVSAFPAVVAAVAAVVAAIVVLAVMRPIVFGVVFAVLGPIVVLGVVAVVFGVLTVMRRDEVGDRLGLVGLGGLRGFRGGLMVALVLILVLALFVLVLIARLGVVLCLPGKVVLVPLSVLRIPDGPRERIDLAIVVTGADLARGGRGSGG